MEVVNQITTTMTKKMNGSLNKNFLIIKNKTGMIQIRKCEKVTVYNTTEVANLNPEDFRALSVPFEGETDEDFLSYLENNRYELEDIYEEIGEEILSELNKIWEPEWTEYSNSAWDGEESWLESGEVNEEYTKTGGFEVRNSTFVY
jgi:hypothetical protein